MQGKRTNIVLFLFSAVLFTCCISCSEKKNGLFSVEDAGKTNIQFINIPDKKPQLNILYYLYYYNGGGVASGDINNDGLPDLYFTANNKGGNKLYLNKGNFLFEDITADAGVNGTSDWCSGVTMADINGDGFLDIYVSAVAGAHGLEGHNELFINNGNLGFTESAAQYGLDFSGFSTQAIFFDYDHDGDLDCYLLNQSQRPNENITDISARLKTDNRAGDRFFRNELDQGLEKFTDITSAAGIYESSLGYGLGIAAADLNNDGWDDLYVGNDFHENDYCYINSGDGSFSEQGKNRFQHYSRFSMGNDIGDYNNDGQPDIITVDMLPPDERTLKTYGSDENMDIYNQKLISHGYQNQYSRNCLQKNNGDGKSFSDVGLMAGISATDWSWGPLLADFDNDGNKDLFISNGIVKRPVDLDYVRYISDLYMQKPMDQTDEYDQLAIDKMPDGSAYPFLFRGNGGDQFTDVSEDWGTRDLTGYSTGATYADLDNDGDLDLVINAINKTAVVLKNNSEGKKYLDLKFEGEKYNTAGIGVKAWLFHNGSVQYQQLMTTRGFQSSVEPRLHFGTDTLNRIDSILIVWPGQAYQVMRNVETNKLLTIERNQAAGQFDYAAFFEKKKDLLDDITGSIRCNWKHSENQFVDFNVQYLIPHEQSTRGPKIAVADVNKDGLDDFFVCGAADQPGCLMTQTTEGNFIKTDTAIFNPNRQSEDVDALFFDADNDGDQDLYVVSGGNQKLDGDPLLADHFYLNNGNGHFSESASPNPVLVNKTSISVADIDKDGDTDIFIGGFAPSRSYGIPQPSYLLINDGNARFTSAPAPVIPLAEAGMVTSSVFTDINNDDWPDLVLAGEWMPVKIYLNEKGVFRQVELPQSTGIWQSLYAADINNDGFTDILAGNWGHNTKLWAGKNGPCKLYIKDFDQNGSLEQILCYTINGKEYPFLAKDELEKPLPTLKKGYLTYSEVAGKTVQYILYNLFVDYREFSAEVLGNSCFINDGKGNFNRTDLRGELQMGPVFGFSTVSINGENAYIAGGNFYGVIPYEGRYDALYPTLFSFDKNEQEHLLSRLTDVKGEIRDIKWLRHASGEKIMVISRNNDSLLFFRLNDVNP